MEKKKYYVSLQSKEISQIQYGNNNDFIIHATDNEVAQLRNTLNQMHEGEMSSYWRAHVPIVPYHVDKGNQQYDAELVQAFEQLYKLGDEATRTFISESGYLGKDITD